MSRREHQRAERCFALARSTTFSGERESAIAKGTAICQRAGISLDEFDIPGRKRTGPPRQPTGDPLFGGNGIFGDGYSYARPWSAYSADDIMSQIDEMLRKGAFQRANVDAERARRNRIRTESAAQFLRARGCIVREFADGTFTVDGHHSPDTRVNGSAVIMAAQSRGWRG